MIKSILKIVSIATTIKTGYDLYQKGQKFYKNYKKFESISQPISNKISKAKHLLKATKRKLIR